MMTSGGEKEDLDLEKTIKRKKSKNNPKKLEKHILQALLIQNREDKRFYFF